MPHSTKKENFLNQAILDFKMKKIFSALYAFLWVAALSQSALAYIDPGTGGVVFNTIWPFIVALFSAVVAFFIKWFWNPIKKLFGKPKNAAKR